MPYLQAFLPRRRFWRVPSLTRQGVALLTGGDAESQGAIMATMDQTPGTTVASLYVRPCGYDKIAAIVRGQFARMQADPQFSRFGTGRSIDSHRQAEQMTVIQLCAL